MCGICGIAGQVIERSTLQAMCRSLAHRQPLALPLAHPGAGIRFQTLALAENTVKNHIRNILEKLHLHSRMEAVVYAVREKLLEIT